MSVASALHTLANYRVHSTRASQEVLEQGLRILEANKFSAIGDEDAQWAFLEQVALAALDVGNLSVADDCLKKLGDKFPNSPRVDVLSGIRMEATEPLDVVLQYYDHLLELDEANGAAWKRRVVVLRRMGKLDKAAEELSSFLDTFYTDLEGWLELADLYTSTNQYTYALQALSHVLLLAPQNPFYMLQFAETAYTAQDLPLAIKTFLVVVDMSDKDASGVTVRAWLGVKLCCRRLLITPSGSIPSPSNTPLVKHLSKIDELATEKVLEAYSSVGKESRPEGNALVREWLSVS